VGRAKSARITEVEPTGLVWRKSSASDTNCNNCVEVASSDQTVHIRDSKNRDGGRITVSVRAWSALLASLREGG
jgi:Domain of unknown function (DUF397)